jgi:hypothetical protein
MPNSGSYISSIPYFLQGTHYDYEFEHKVVISSATIKVYDPSNVLVHNYTVGEDLIIKKYSNYYCFNFEYNDYAEDRWLQVFVKDDADQEVLDLYVVALPENYDDIDLYGFSYLGSGEDWDIEDYYEWEVSENEYTKYVFEEGNMYWQSDLGTKAEMEEYQASMNDVFDISGGSEEDNSSFNSDPNCLAGNCYDGYGMKQYDGGDMYCGFFKNGRRHYYGGYFWKEGGFYIGTWFENEYSEDKHGIEVFPDGDIKYHTDARSYSDWGESGCVSGDCDNGWGVYIWSSGNMHAGSWKNSKMHLIGLQFWASGDFWFGMYDEGDRKTNRHGIYVWDGGDKAVYNDPISPFGPHGRHLCKDRRTSLRSPKI